MLTKLDIGQPHSSHPIANNALPDLEVFGGFFYRPERFHFYIFKTLAILVVIERYHRFEGLAGSPSSSKSFSCELSGLGS